ncbi:MAG TPA: azurin [Flavobacteriaceae bacterium]|nr:azurin [Flavobacteriaceae bacterium]
MKTIKYVLSSFMVFALLVNCGGGEKKKEESSNKIQLKATDTKKEADDNVANIVITANDQMQYNLKEIKVKAGQKVKVTLRHIGVLDKNVMGHNFVILKPGVKMADFAAKASTEKANDYIPEGTQDVIAHTKLIGGGETTSIEFEAPPVGTYTFMCSFPAHFAMMNGKFIVE